jgi:hypothetical protein
MSLAGSISAEGVWPLVPPLKTDRAVRVRWPAHLWRAVAGWPSLTMIAGDVLAGPPVALIHLGLLLRREIVRSSRRRGRGGYPRQR